MGEPLPRALVGAVKIVQGPARRIVEGSMLRLCALVLAAILLGAGAAQESFPVVNVMPAFWQAWDSTQGQPVQERVAKFKALVIRPNMEVYGFDEFANIVSNDNRLARYLDLLEPHISQMRQISQNLPDQIDDAEASFAKQLPDFDSSRIKVYFMPSFGIFNGQTHDIGQKVGVLFGVDEIAANGGQENIGVDVAHELFHVYQYEAHPGVRSDQARLWQAVWIEGSAAWASQQLTPGATEAQALGDVFTQTNPDERKQLACDLLDDWDSHNPSIMATYLQAGVGERSLPARGGYLIGYLVAHQLANDNPYSISQIGKLPFDRVEPRMHDDVRKICAGKPV